MSAVQQFILSVDNDPEEARNIAKTTSIHLENKETSLVQVVESLEEYINDESDSIRSKAIKFLIQVFEVLPSNFLSRQQIQVLCQFLCDRIEDDGALHGITVLANLSRFTSEMAIMTFRAIHEHFGDLQASSQSKRYEVISLLNILLTKYRPSIRSLASESLLALVDLFGGERDPRNLMLVFSIFRIVIAEWDLGEHVENVFDSVFCYFPITFRPPPNDPYGITAQDLKTRLKDCISASQSFAPYAFPQLIVKLDANSINAKRDVLETLSACATSYSSQTISTYAITIWDALKFEVFNAQEEELSEMALSALQAIALKLHHANDNANSLSSFLQPIAADCNERLREPQQKQAQPAAFTVGSLAATSHNALSIFAHSCIPPLLGLYREAQNFEMRRAVLEAISEILRGSTEIVVMMTGSESPLLDFKEDLFQIFSQALMGGAADETAFRLAALKCLNFSCESRGFLDQNEIGMVIQYLDDIILKPESFAQPILRDRAIESLSQISQVAPNLVSDIAIPNFLAQLPDSGDAAKSTYGALNCIARFRFNQDLSSMLSRRLLNKARTVARISNTSQYLRALLASTYLIFGQHDLTRDPHLQSYFDTLTELIKEITIPRKDDNEALIQSNPAITVMLGRMTAKILRALNPEAQPAISQQFFKLLDESDKPEANNIHLRRPSRSDARILSTYAMAALQKGAPPPASEEQLLASLDELISVAQREANPTIRLNALQQIALIVNKFLSAGGLTEAEERLWHRDEGLLSSKQKNMPSVRAGFWIAKGLIVRLANIDDILRRLLDQVSDENHGMDMARGFELLLCPDEILAREYGATIRRLAPQKIFDRCLAEIITRLRNIPIALKPNFIVALSGILKYLTADIITPRADDLLPLLLQALDLSNSGVKDAAIQTLGILVRTSPEAVESHAPSLINRLLNTAKDSSDEMEKVRYGALECLEIFPGSIKNSTLIPYRRAALKGMLRILDDPRRQVRKKAVDCRTAWLNLDEPEEDG